MQLMVILQLEKVEAISLNCVVYRKNTNWLQKAHIRCERLQLVAQGFLQTQTAAPEGWEAGDLGGVTVTGFLKGGAQI